MKYVWILMLIGSSVWAADKKSDVLDFDADVIEGQKKAPEIFLQTDVQKPALDTVLYQRRDFNDFHASDSRVRPRLADPPNPKGAPKK